PMIELANGEIRPLARVRTRRRALEALFDVLQQAIPVGGRVHAAVQHVQAPEEASRFAERLQATFNCVELLTTPFTPVMGSYCGPGLIGVAWYVDEDEADD
ncbi:MAG: degV family protein, partial [Chloroflexi bacterium]|nr:degV family protein [Chloroflexota bacterium]